MRKRKLINAGIMLIAAVSICFLYELQIAETNAYMGYLPGIFTPQNLLISALMFVGVIISMPDSIRRPSDFFLLFYTVIVLFSCCLFSQVTGLIDGFDSIILYLVLMLPVSLVVVIRRVSIPAKFVGLFNQNAIYYSLLGVLALSAMVGAVADTGAGFAWDSMYERRLAGRDSIGSGNVTAYLMSMTINGIGPFLAFVGVLRRRFLFTICGFGFSVFAFWLLGLKAPFVVCSIFMMVGYFIRTGHLKNFPMLVGSLVALTGVLALVDSLIFGYSLLAEIVIRRVFVMQAAIQSYFFDLIGNSFTEGLYAGLFGVDSSSYGSVTFLVGAVYLDSATANANTNAFLYALSSGGVVSFLLANLFVGTFFMFLDRYYQAVKRADIFFVGAVYGLLLTEQAYTTAFVSSGVGVVFAAIVLIRRDASHMGGASSSTK